MKNVELIPPGAGDALDVLGVLLKWPLRSGPFGIAEAVAPPGAAVPVHSHPETEAFLLQFGTVEFARVEGGEIRWTPATVGGTVFIPSNQMHGFRNAGSTEARMLIVCEPGLERFFFEAGTPRNAVQPPTPADVERVIGVAMRYGHRFA